MSGRPGTSQLHRISALRASSVVAAGTPRAKSPPPRVSAFHPAHMVASQSLEACTKSYRAPAQAYISRSIVAQVAHIAHTSSRSRQPPTLHHTFVPTCRSDSRPSTPKLTRCWGAGPPRCRPGLCGAAAISSPPASHVARRIHHKWPSHPSPNNFLLLITVRSSQT